MIRPFGEAALLVELDDPDQAQALAASLRHDPIPGILEVVPGLRSVLLELEPGAFPSSDAGAAIEERLPRVAASAPEPRERTIPVVYGGEHGPDLAEVAELCGLGTDEVIRRHVATGLRVLFIGFAPGFAYLGDLPEELRVPRLATPRTRTPAGSVGVAGAMSGIYPAELPGGWRVIGRTPLTLFDPRREPPAYLAPGDAVRFEPIEAEAWDALAGSASDWE